jgi:hypothetical protein
MKEAGLNPSLMYGMSGAGGQTTGGQGGGSAASGSTPNAPMDIAGAVKGGMAIAQLKLMEAQTAKTGEEAVAQAIDNEVMVKGGKDAAFAENTNRYLKAGGEYEAFLKDNEMYQKQSKSETDRMVNEAILSEMEKEAKAANIELTKEKTNEIWHSVRQKWMNAGFNGLQGIIKTAIKK